MNYLLNAFALLLLFFGMKSPLAAQTDTVLTNATYKSSVKTVEISREGWKLSYPVMELGSSSHLVLSFDDLADNAKNYQYTIIHCTADWRPSDLVQGDYIEGFTSSEIDDYDYSFNTLHNYIHYEISLPNNDINLSLSGNYVILVYEDYDRANVVLTKRFSLYKKQVNIEADIKRATLAQHSGYGQEMDFSINYGSYRINDPYSELKVMVRQNNRWDRSVVGLMPKFVHDSKLIYEFDDENVFKGGNEFRFFGAQSVRYKSQQIKEIVFADPYYHIELRKDRPRETSGYSYHEDINGKYYIDVQESERDALQADYVFVHFSLVTDYPLPGKNVYIAGELAGWEYGKHNKMEFNPQTGAYERVLLLKQGYYNYEYVVRSKSGNFPDDMQLEGNHYQTENDYLIFVYHQRPGGRYDKLIGYVKVNTLDRL